MRAFYIYKRVCPGVRIPNLMEFKHLWIFFWYIEVNEIIIWKGICKSWEAAELFLDIDHSYKSLDQVLSLAKGVTLVCLGLSCSCPGYEVHLGL